MVDFAVADPMEAFQGTENQNPYAPVGAGRFFGSEFAGGVLHSLLEPVARGMSEQSGETGVDFSAAMDPGGFGNTLVPARQLPTFPTISPDDLMKRYPGVKFDTPMTADVAEDYVKSRQDQDTRAALAARYPSGVGKFVLGLGANVAASFLDPIQDAANFVPVVGEARYGRWLASAGERAGMLGRFGVTAGVGAARGVAAQVPISAIRLVEAQSAEGNDYTLGNAAWDTLVGGLQGGILHTGLSFRDDVLGRRFLESPQGVAASQSADLHDAAIRTAASQMADGLPVDVEPIFAAHSNSLRSRLMETTAPDPATETRFADAQARANGAPSDDAVRWTHDAADAARTPPEAVTASQMAEAEAAVHEMRARGELTPEDEALLAEHEPKPVDEEAVFRGDGEAPAGWGSIEGDRPPGAADGERRVLADGITAVLPKDIPPHQQALIDEVERVANKIIPSADVLAVKRLEVSLKAGAGNTPTGNPVGVNLHGVRRLIAWSLESSDAVGTVKHEAIHYLRQRGLIQGPEWAALEREAVKSDWLGKHNIETRYPGATPAQKIEEAVAEEFSNWRRDGGKQPALIQRAFQRVKDFLAEVGSRVRQMFGGDVSSEDVFRRIASGEVGARKPFDESSVAGPASFQIPDSEEARQEQMDAAVLARKKLNAYQDLQKRNALTIAIAGFKAQGVSLENGIDALTRGINTAVKGARDSTAAEQLSRQNDFLGQLQHGLDKEGLMAAWRKRGETANWVRELHELNSDGGKPGVTKSSIALKIAKAVQAAQDTARLHLNRSGAWVGDYDGYVSRTRHDPYKIDHAGFQVWRDFTLARLDQDKTFAEIDPDLSPADRATAIERFMSNAWDALSTGIHMSSDHGVGRGKNLAFAGIGANLAKKVSSERVLHWKDADSWRQYQERFADPVIERGVMEGLRRAGADTALMNRWGTNPAYTFDNLLRTLKEKHRDDHELVRSLGKAEPRLRREFDILTGNSKIPVNKLASQISGTIRAWQDISKLSFVLFTHMSVGATKPFQLKYHGVGRWQAYTSVIRNLVQDNSPQGRQTLENLRANATGQSQDILSGYEPVDGVPGSVAKLRSLSIRLGGLPWMLNRQKVGTEWELSNFLGQRVGNTFDKLHPATQRALKIYGIEAPEWDALRNAPDHDTDKDGATFLTPKAAMRAATPDIDNLATDRLAKVGTLDPDAADRIRAETRDKLAMKLASYFSDSADRSTVTPGIPERAFFNRAGELGPIVGQYKTWATAAVRQMWGQAIYGSSKGEAVKALAELVAVGTALGFAANTIKAELKGQNAQFPNGDVGHDIDLMAAAMSKGGGMGIFGDFILGQIEDSSGTGTQRAARLLGVLAGPTASDVVRVGGIGADYLTAAKQKHPGKALQTSNAEALRLGIDNLPFVNSFYVRTLANYLILDRLQEMASPGYLKRYQARIKQQSGQTFWLPPTHYLGAH